MKAMMYTTGGHYTITYTGSTNIVLEWLVAVTCILVLLFRLNPLVPVLLMNFREVTFKPYIVINGLTIPCKIALRWILLDVTDYKSTLAQVMVCCPQATNHYLSQCWPIYVAIWRHFPLWINDVIWLRRSLSILVHARTKLPLFCWQYFQLYDLGW